VNLKKLAFLILCFVINCSVKAVEVRLSDIKALANEWCGNSDIQRLELDACLQFCGFRISTCEERILKTRDLMVKCSPAQQQQFKQLRELDYRDCKRQIQPLEDMKFVDAKLCPNSKELSPKCQDYCNLVHGTCEENILKTKDLMMRCTDKQKGMWAKFKAEKFRECKQESPSIVPIIEKTKKTYNRDNSRDLYEEECMETSPSKQCNGFCSLSRSTCEESVLAKKLGKKLDYYDRCNSKEKEEWEKMLEHQYTICMGTEETPVKEQETSQALLERKIKELVSRGKLAFKESLSLQDLAVLVALAKELEKEGIAIGSDAQASGKHKEEL
jgi:hypothetical protein